MSDNMVFAGRWDEITSCIANSTELKMFPTFAYAYRRSYSALPIESARDTDQLGEFACLLSLLRGISTSSVIFTVLSVGALQP